MSHQRQSPFLFGFMAGAAAALLFAPRSGVQTRRIISDKAKETQARIQREGTHAYEAASETLGRGKKAVKQTVTGITKAFEAGRRTLAG